MRNLLLTVPQSFTKQAQRGKQLTLLFVMLSVLLMGFFALNNTPEPNNSGNNYAAVSMAALPAADAIPDVQIFVPGFSVKELPVSLTNINVLRYGPDGKLYALAYDGHVYVLTDTNGDGLEDKAEAWWDKDLLLMPVAMVVSKEGIYVTSKNKLSLIKDNDKDGKAETEEILTTDWTKPFVYTGTTETGVDAFGLAKDKNGDIYFALGTADFTNAYVVKDGKANYDIKSERGTILKLTPGSTKREIYCTGTRFPVAMAFNENGDLFASEQEGATWLGNGNPYDELLHIEKDRHYGFPPRHPKYLPGVIDEPSVFDYKPQHQSTCGLTFNEPVNGGPTFGPDWWRNNAFVCGYSRGKIYRTEIIKTASGYVAQNAIIGSTASLVVDASPSPQGDLVISTHSGKPDWGFGPQAKGKLYKIFYTNKQLPQPVAVWASNPNQVKITFDKAVPKNYLVGLADKIGIEYNEFVAAGDRYEIYRPGYQAVERQQRQLREKLGVKTAELSDDGRTLILNTFTQIEPVSYAIKLPAFADDKASTNAIPQSPYMDLAYNLNGIDVSWQAASGNEKWTGTVPHLDMTVTNAFTKAFPASESLKTILGKEGKATWKTKLDLWYMLRPITQPELAIDYTWPDEDVTLVLKSSAPLEVKAGTATVTPSAKTGDMYETKLTFNKVERKPYDLEIAMSTGGKPWLEVYYFTKEDARHRALQVSRFFAPWVKDVFPKEVKISAERPELAGGNWSRGKKLFFGEAICSTCHSVNGQGKNIGPDLTNLIFRDYASVLRDIHSPSAAMNPDYVAYTVTLKDKKKLTGMVSYKKDSMFVRDLSGHKTAVALTNVESTKAMSVSMMPEGLDKMLGPQKTKDLLTYLLTSLKAQKLDFPFLPDMRPGAEVVPVFQTYTPPPRPAGKIVKPLRILWVAGAKDPAFDPKNIWQQNKRDYPLQQERWSHFMNLADNVKFTKANAWPTAAQFAAADVIVFHWDYPQFSEANGKQLDAFLAKGGGVVYINQAIKANNPEILAARIGLAFKNGASKFREGPIEFTFEQNNPITKGFVKTRFQEEAMWQLVEGAKPINVLATSFEDGKKQPAIWTTTGPGGKGKVFVMVPGFWDWTYDDPLYRILMLRGIAWAGSKPVYSYEEIANMGARATK